MLCRAEENRLADCVFIAVRLKADLPLRFAILLQYFSSKEKYEKK
jgi:hypothetical protein